MPGTFPASTASYINCESVLLRCSSRTILTVLPDISCSRVLSESLLLARVNVRAVNNLAVECSSVPCLNHPIHVFPYASRYSICTRIVRPIHRQSVQSVSLTLSVVSVLFWSPPVEFDKTMSDVDVARTSVFSQCKQPDDHVQSDPSSVKGHPTTNGTLAGKQHQCNSKASSPAVNHSYCSSSSSSSSSSQEVECDPIQTLNGKSCNPSHRSVHPVLLAQTKLVAARPPAMATRTTRIRSSPKRTNSLLTKLSPSTLLNTIHHSTRCLWKPSSRSSRPTIAFPSTRYCHSGRAHPNVSGVVDCHVDQCMHASFHPS